MITGMSAHSALIARSSSSPSRSGIRTSTSARSNSVPPCRIAPARRPRTPPRPHPRPGSLPSRHSSSHAARARGRPRSRSSSSSHLPSDGEHGDHAWCRVPGVDLDRPGTRRAVSARARMIRSPKCGSSSVTAAIPRPRSSISMRSSRPSARHPHVHLGRSRVLRGVRERLRSRSRARPRATVLGHRLEVALDRDRAGKLPPSTRSATNAANVGSSATAALLVISKSSSRISPQVFADRVSTSCSVGDRARRVGLDPVAEGLQLQHGGRHRLGEPVVDLHRPARALLEHAAIRRHARTVGCHALDAWLAWRGSCIGAFVLPVGAVRS